MSGLDMQASFNNLTQADRLQQEAQKAPLAHRVHSAEEAKQETAQRLNMPTQPDDLEKQDPDAHERKRVFLSGKKRKKKKTHRAEDRHKSGEDGLFIDYSA